MLIFIIFLFIVGIYFSIKLKFNNLNLIKMVKSIIKKDDGISTFSSLCISLASKIGVGSLSGVAFSIYVGGVGSIFWMWITTIICSSNTMAECILSVKHRITVDNNYEGGPFYYIKDKLLAFCYAFFLLITYIFGFLPIQSNTISTVICNIVDVPNIVIGIVIGLLLFLIIIKGIRGISDVATTIVPIMTIIYITTCLYIVFKNIILIDDIVLLIIKEAFNKRSFLTGFIVGTTKSIFSTESGLGTTSIACASANTDYKTASYSQTLGTHFDTFVISTLTVFVIMLSPYTNLNIHNINGIEITRYAFMFHLGRFGGVILTISILLFAFSTLIGGYYYVEVALKYINKSINTNIIKILFIFIVILSTVISSNIIWNLIDIFMVFIGLINIISLLILRKEVKM